MGKGEYKEQCIYYTGLCAGKVAEIVIRELGLTNMDEQMAQFIDEKERIWEIVLKKFQSIVWSYASFTFPFVISVIASKQTKMCLINMEYSMPIL